ncbi:uncharacterized protein LY89DRAFT_716224 [Mollisia scopiformis]|uniref:Uncharacterized protein n=1 Tax=Mollisia scopiformis TaxID=149040 RepID=A0A194XHL1_MOLSC|nr:uncharacterized protein LY89DRAFT_716224 [Mollisia scopiformis]KUJ19700.1 hypothetical protein LY89DRAFT_716224 [Mollisia scopiformis]
MKSQHIPKPLISTLIILTRLLKTAVFFAPLLLLLLILSILQILRQGTYLFFTASVSYYDYTRPQISVKGSQSKWRMNWGLALFGVWVMVMMAVVLGFLDWMQMILSNGVQLLLCGIRGERTGREEMEDNPSSTADFQSCHIHDYLKSLCTYLSSKNIMSSSAWRVFNTIQTLTLLYFLVPDLLRSTIQICKQRQYFRILSGEIYYKNRDARQADMPALEIVCEQTFDYMFDRIPELYFFGKAVRSPYFITLLTYFMVSLIWEGDVFQGLVTDGLRKLRRIVVVLCVLEIWFSLLVVGQVWVRFVFVMSEMGEVSGLWVSRSGEGEV